MARNGYISDKKQVSDQPFSIHLPCWYKLIAAQVFSVPSHFPTYILRIKYFCPSNSLHSSSFPFSLSGIEINQVFDTLSISNLFSNHPMHRSLSFIATLVLVIAAVVSAAPINVDLDKRGAASCQSEDRSPFCHPWYSKWTVAKISHYVSPASLRTFATLLLQCYYLIVNVFTNEKKRLRKTFNICNRLFLHSKKWIASFSTSSPVGWKSVNFFADVALLFASSK